LIQLPADPAPLRSPIFGASRFPGLNRSGSPEFDKYLQQAAFSADWQKWYGLITSAMAALRDKFPPLLADVRDFGLVAGSAADANTRNLKAAFDWITGQGGGVLWVPPQEQPYDILDVDVPSNVSILGLGYNSAFRRGGALPAGRGLFNLTNVQNVAFENLRIDGATTVATDLLYTDFGSDPMHALLTANTSIWVHPGCSGIRFRAGWIEHTGGYAILFDADTADISDAEVLDWWFKNNRPHRFGTNPADKTYGSWTGGLFWRMDGRAAQGKLSSVKGLKVSGCHWRRVTGNCLWGHTMGFDARHVRVHCDFNDFEDIGLDGILVGNVRVGSAIGNKLHRVGYMTQTDVDQAEPKYLAGLFATAIDGGFSENIEYSKNVGMSMNGSFIDTDGHRKATIHSNVGQNPEPGDSDYVTDRCGLFGPNQNGVNTSTGINAGNSQQNGGSVLLAFLDNTLVNFGVSAIVMGYSKQCRCAQNTIYHRADASAAPIQLFSAAGGAGNELLCLDNRIEGNTIEYGGGHYCIEETGAGWTAAAVNKIWNNHLLGGGGAGHFLKDPASSSVSGQPVLA